MTTNLQALSPSIKGVCYRPGKPTIADYNEAISALLAAKHQIQSGSLMACDICGDSGHAAQDGCHHDPLILARKWAAAAGVWHCYHCGFVATNDEEAREHFGKNEFDAAACVHAPESPWRPISEAIEKASGLVLGPNGSGGSKITIDFGDPLAARMLFEILSDLPTPPAGEEA